LCSPLPRHPVLAIRARYTFRAFEFRCAMEVRQWQAERKKERKNRAHSRPHTQHAPTTLLTVRAARNSAAAHSRAPNRGFYLSLSQTQPRVRLAPHAPAHCSRRVLVEIETEIGTPERTRAWTLGAVGWASRMLSARIRMRPPYAPLPLPGTVGSSCQAVAGPSPAAFPRRVELLSDEELDHESRNTSSRLPS
jgi:hypothetical protein